MVAKRPKHLGAFRLGDYLPTVHAACIRDYPIVNMVYPSAVETLDLHHIASVPLRHFERGYSGIIPNDHIGYAFCCTRAGDWRMDKKPTITYVHTTDVAIKALSI